MFCNRDKCLGSAKRWGASFRTKLLRDRHKLHLSYVREFEVGLLCYDAESSKALLHAINLTSDSSTDAGRKLNTKVREELVS